MGRANGSQPQGDPTGVTPQRPAVVDRDGGRTGQTTARGAPMPAHALFWPRPGRNHAPRVATTALGAFHRPASRIRRLAVSPQEAKRRARNRDRKARNLAIAAPRSDRNAKSSAPEARRLALARLFALRPGWEPCARSSELGPQSREPGARRFLPCHRKPRSLAIRPASLRARSGTLRSAVGASRAWLRGSRSLRPITAPVPQFSSAAWIRPNAKLPGYYVFFSISGKCSSERIERQSSMTFSMNSEKESAPDSTVPSS